MRHDVNLGWRSWLREFRGTLIRRSFLNVAMAIGIAWPSATIHGQAVDGRDFASGNISQRRWSEAGAGTELERYLRVLGMTNAGARSQWTVRAFSLAELDARTPADTIVHPWQGRLGRTTTRGIWVVRPAAEAIVNSGFPWGMNDGPIWAGRGMSGLTSAGFALRVGILSAQFAPVAWHTQNLSFPLLPSADPKRPLTDFGRWAPYLAIDLPQRMGTAPVGRIDPGESYVRLDAFGVAAGVSTAAEWWGPGVQGASLLGSNAGGIPRVFAGTSESKSIGIGRVHGRAFVGRAVASPVGMDVAPKRVVMGTVGSFMPRGISGLEIGGARFFHRRWTAQSPSFQDVRLLWESFLKSGLSRVDDPNSPTQLPDNQLASVFVRLAPPGAGFEVFGEFAREDHSWDAIDLAAEPDHVSLFTVGFQKLLGQRQAKNWWVIRGELVNGRVTHLLRVRPQSLMYEHYSLRDGHTLRGQLLASPYGRGGSGAEVGVDRYDRTGRQSLRWQRIGLATSAEGGMGYGAMHALEASGTRLIGPGDLTWRLGVQRRVGNVSSYDLGNVHMALGWRLGW